MIVTKKLFSIEDEELQLHNYRVGKMSSRFAKFVGLHEQMIEDIAICGSLHDIGKAVIPKRILNKPTTLTNEEFKQIKMHSIYSYMILREMGYNEKICLISKYHHENYNGTGYPDKLKEKEIPLGARVLRIVDMFDALTNDRIYRKAMNKKSALFLMVKENHLFDPDLFSMFKDFIDIAMVI
ncbi:HD domain-containing protein [Alkalibaculum bacchi]|uniref:HD domain-containing protein n=1 Tax=Alkalibaculum bacchi TaxID=645887 RepID=A0A366HYV7_9FIRM|nr:HD domain-containing phosphohydrolase [Alkalibaculum bacchi]RBP59306.1 HD domain-containing protein [Alkalibaculum bacchi]